MWKKRETKTNTMWTWYKCSKCWEFKRESDFFKHKNMWKQRVSSWCKECKRKYENERWKTEEELARKRENKRRYRQTKKWQIRQKIDDYLYKKDKNFIRTKKIFEELDEWKKKRTEYKKNYIIFNVPEEIATKEEKMLIFNMTEEEYERYVMARRDRQS